MPNFDTLRTDTVAAPLAVADDSPAGLADLLIESPGKAVGWRGMPGDLAAGVVALSEVAAVLARRRRRAVIEVQPGGDVLLAQVRVGG